MWKLIFLIYSHCLNIMVFSTKCVCLLTWITSSQDIKVSFITWFIYTYRSKLLIANYGEYIYQRKLKLKSSGILNYLVLAHCTLIFLYCQPLTWQTITATINYYYYVSWIILHMWYVASTALCYAIYDKMLTRYRDLVGSIQLIKNIIEKPCNAELLL